jgi:hypothetical protein
MKTILIFIFALVINFTFAEEPVVNTSVDSNSVLIGKPVRLSIDFNSKEELNVIFPVIEDSLEKLELLNMSEPDTVVANELRRIKRTYTITSFDSGSYDLGPYSIVYSRDTEDEFNVVRTQPVKVTFSTLPVDTSQAIKDIKPPIHPGWSISEFYPYIIILVLIIAIIIIYFYSKRRKKSQSPWIIDKPKIPAHTEAFEALNILKEEQLWQNGKVKEYHIRITEILRRYIERRYEIMALEMITDDILEEFSHVNSDSQLLQKLKDVLTLGDLAKFAKFNPLPKENENSFEYTYDFVKQTIPVKQENMNNKSEDENA